MLRNSYSVPLKTDVELCYVGGAHQQAGSESWRRCRKKTGAGDSLFARLNNTTTMPALMKILL